MKSLFHSIIYVHLALFAAGNFLAGSAGAQPASPALRQEIVQLLDRVDLATWTQTSWERLGDEEHYTAAHCLWASPDDLRLDVFDGRGTGSSAILYQGRVYGFRSGLLRFFKRSYDVRHQRVLSLRGHDMRDIGFLVQFERILDRWNAVSMSKVDRGPVLTFTDDAGLRNELWLNAEPLYAYRHDVYEDDVLVERYTYASVVYNPEVDRKRLVP